MQETLKIFEILYEKFVSLEDRIRRLDAKDMKLIQLKLKLENRFGSSPNNEYEIVISKKT